MKKMNNKGFTLVELLATIAILSLVIMITLYVAVDVIGNARRKSYLVTINNIENQASNYLLENSDRLFYLSSGDIEYQCLTIQNLIDMDYFDNKILKSKVGDETTVSKDDYVYIERDKTTKSITKSEYINDASEINRLCDVAVVASGDIDFDVKPTDWSLEKDVTITYKVKNANNINDYSYWYKVGTSDNLKSDYNKKTITIDDNVTIYAYILYDKDNEVIVEKQISISMIDKEKPIVSVESTNNVAQKQTVTVNFRDEGSGLKEYYFGTVVPSSGSDWETISMVDGKYRDSYQTSKEITNSGTYYFAVKDGLGNQSDIKEVTFYKTSFSVSNGTVSVSNVLTMKGNSFTLPSVSVSTGYTASGYWYSDTGYTQSIGQYGNSYIVNKNTTLYSKGNANTYTIKYLCGNGSGSAPVSQTVKYDSSVAIASNTCTPPTGYSFSKWYDPTGDNNWTGWSGTWKYVNGSRYGITNNTLTLTAQYTPNTYTIKFDGNGSTSGTTSSVSCTYDRNCTLTSNGFSRSGYSFDGWATSASGSVIYTNAQSVKNLAKLGTVTLYAQWKLDYTCYKITSSLGVACNSLPQPTDFGGTKITDIPKNYYVWGIADKMGYHSSYREYWYYVDNYIRCEDDECSTESLGCYIIAAGAQVMEDTSYCEKGNKVSSSGGYGQCTCRTPQGAYCYSYDGYLCNVTASIEDVSTIVANIYCSTRDDSYMILDCAK